MCKFQSPKPKTAAVPLPVVGLDNQEVISIHDCASSLTGYMAVFLTSEDDTKLQRHGHGS